MAKTINGEKTSHNGVNYLPGFFGKGFVLLTLAHLIATYSTEIFLIRVKLLKFILCGRLVLLPFNSTNDYKTKQKLC